MSRSACGVDGGSARGGKEDGPRRQAPAPAGVTAGGGWSAGTRAVPRVSWRASPGRAAKVSPAPRSTTLPRHGRRVNGVVCVLCSPAPHCSAFTGTAAILLLPPPDHPACAPCHRPHPWQGPALVPLPGHSLVHGLHEGLLMRRFYPYMSVRTALSASWPHTNPQPACAHVWRMRHTARCSPTFSAHSRHTSRPRSEVHAHTWRMRLRNREWGKGCSQSEKARRLMIDALRQGPSLASST